MVGRNIYARQKPTKGVKTIHGTADFVSKKMATVRFLIPHAFPEPSHSPSRGGVRDCPHSLTLVGLCDCLQ